jgi:hypothetical protein
MSVTYTWKITGLRTKTEGSNVDAVVQSHWEKTGTDEHGHTAAFIGATPFTSTNVPEGEFVAFANLTEETVLGWIQSAINADPSYAAHIDERIQKKLDYYHVSEPVLPWNNEPSVAPEPETRDINDPNELPGSER